MARIFLILSAMMVFKHAQCVEPPGYINGKCNRNANDWRSRRWSQRTRNGLALMAEALNINEGDYARAHRIPYSYIKRSILNFPQTWRRYNQDIGNWKKAVGDLAFAIHSVDKDYFGYKAMSETNKATLIKNSNDNLDLCKGYLLQIPDRSRIVDGNILARQIDDLCHCMFNAPGNVRPGYIGTNGALVNYFDPMLTEQHNKHYKVKRADLTPASKDLASTYRLDYKETHYGIYSSDQDLI